MNIMILCAGEGRRFRPHTEFLPKPAIPFLNIPLAFYSLGFLKSMFFHRLVLNTFHLPQHVHALKSMMPDFFKNKVTFSDEKLLLGSAGGLKNAEALFDLNQENIILLNGDELILPMDIDWLEQMLLQHQKSNNLATLAVMQHPEVGTKFGGIWTNSQNLVKSIGKEPSDKLLKGWHYIGVQILNKKILDYIPHSLEQNIFYDILVHHLQEKVQAFPIKCDWFETGNLKDYLSATEICLKKIPNNLYLNKMLSDFAPTVEIIKSSEHILCKDNSALVSIDNALNFSVCGPQFKASKKVKLEKCVFVGSHNIQTDMSSGLYID